MGPETKPSLSSRISVWLRRLRGILTSFWTAVLSLSSKFRTPNEYSAETVHPQDTPTPETQGGESGPPPLVVRSIANAPNTENNRQSNTPLWEKAAVLIALGLLVVNTFQMCANKKAADAAKSSAVAAKQAADTAANQLELSERPWVKIVDVKTLGNGPIIPALSFQKIGPYKDYGPYKDVSQQATFQLVISLKNIGHSVADVAASYELFFPVWDSGKYWDEISSEQKRFCDSAAGKVPQFYPKFVVFPDEPFDWHGAAVGLIHSGVTNHLPGQGETGYILPVIIVCANYRLRPLPNSYQTRTIYEAFHTEDRTRFFKIGEGVPAKRILLIRNEMADDAY